MSWSRIRAIYRKDMRDALRDSRVLTALIMPLAFGLLYSSMFSNEQVQKVRVGLISEGRTQLTAALQRQAPANVHLTFVRMDQPGLLADQVRRKKLDVGLILAARFDAQVKAGLSPQLVILQPAKSSFGGDYVAAVVERSVQDMAGQSPAARIVQRSLPAPPGGATAFDVLGPRTGFILVSVILVLAMIAVYAVPAVLVEETEAKTMEALTMIASTGEVIAAKALFGMTLSVVAVPVLLAITPGTPADVGAFAGVVVVSAVVVVGIGLLFAGVVRNQQQVNTWSGIVLMALLAPAFTIGLAAPEVVNKVLWVIPTGQTFRLIANAFAGRALYPQAWLSAAVLLLWGIGTYGLLWWRLSRQEDA